MKTIVLLALFYLPLCGQLRAQTWTQKTSLPGDGRDAALVFTIGNKMYVGGGTGSTDFWEYDSDSYTWTKKADIPGVTSDRSFGAAFAINNKGYVGLGADGGITSSVLTKDLWEYDPVANTWTRKADFPGVARDGCFCFAVNNKAYVGGGFDGQFFLYDFYEYDPAANAWTQKADYPLPGIIFPFAFSIGNKGYLACGASATELTDTYEYNPAADQWTQKASFPGTARQAGAVFVLHDKAYCGLGQTGYTSCFRDFYAYNPSTDTWSLVGNFSGSARAWPNAGTVNGKAFIGLGWDFSHAASNDWWEFNLITNVPESANTDGLVCYPNPSNGMVHIQYNQKNTLYLSYKVINMLGQVVKEGAIPGSTINLSGHPTGQYMLELTMPDRKTTRTMIQLDETR